jgi:hypothetical protein
MVTPDSEFSRSDPTSAVDDTTASLPASAISQLPSERIGRLLVFAAMAGLAAGVAWELIGEGILNSYNSDLNPPLQMNPNPEDMRRLREARLYTTTFTFTTPGGTLGAGAGTGGGIRAALDRRERRGGNSGARSGIGNRRILFSDPGVDLF